MASSISLLSTRSVGQGGDHYARIDNLVQDLEDTVKRCVQLREEIHRIRIQGHQAGDRVLEPAAFIEHRMLTPPASIYELANTTWRDSTFSPMVSTSNAVLPELNVDEALAVNSEGNLENRDHDSDEAPPAYENEGSSIYSHEESATSSDTSNGTEVGDVILGEEIFDGI